MGQGGKQHPMAYGSRMLRGAELKYAPIQGECFAVLHWLHHFRQNLYGRHIILLSGSLSFQVVDDYGSVRYAGMPGHETAGV